jgi:hypothetical protein
MIFNNVFSKDLRRGKGLRDLMLWRDKLSARDVGSGAKPYWLHAEALTSQLNWCLQLERVGTAKKKATRQHDH